MNYSTKTYPRAYFADLDAYNAGRLKGVWIDFYDHITPDEVMEQVEEMLGPDGEEWAIHDSEGFGDLVSEYMAIDLLCDIAELINQRGEDAVVGFINHSGVEYLSEFENCYVGEYESEEEFVEEHFSELLDKALDIEFPWGSRLFSYVDLQAIANDCFCGDYWSYEPHYGQCHVYISS
jgi:antirestriction protein